MKALSEPKPEPPKPETKTNPQIPKPEKKSKPETLKPQTPRTRKKNQNKQNQN